MTAADSLPFDESRRLIGGNLFFAAPGAVLESSGIVVDALLIEAWRSRILRAAQHLGWAQPVAVARTHPGGASFALQAPADQLFVATEINEWALCAAARCRDPERWRGLEARLIAQYRDARAGSASELPEVDPVLEDHAALARFERLARAEARPGLRALLEEARTRDIPVALDDAELTLGSGSKGQSFRLGALPAATEVPWERLGAVPTALITGSNGKTTTVRLLAACARAAGRHAAFNCTDGVFFDDQAVAAGDYAGPLGARLVVRERRAQTAILETARGGILRRGIAVSRADAAIVTNVSADHFGEYGIYDLEALAEAKLTVAAPLSARGVLVLNADDAALRVRAEHLALRLGRVPELAWFSAEPESPRLTALREAGAATCGVRDERLWLDTSARFAEAGSHLLGRIADMPLTVEGAAAYNIANLAGAALTAAALGIPCAAIAAVFARFGAAPGDNPGRMMRYEREGVTILIDYAHNPEGLRGFLQVARHLSSGQGRLGLVLGHAGNRSDADIRELARTAAQYRPDLIVIKENEQHLRGRALKEIPRVLRRELEGLGFPDAALPYEGSELGAVRHALAWARPGDVLALPVHSSSARAAVLSLIERAVHLT